MKRREREVINPSFLFFALDPPNQSRPGDKAASFPKQISGRLYRGKTGWGGPKIADYIVHGGLSTPA